MDKFEQKDAQNENKLIEEVRWRFLTEHENGKLQDFHSEDVNRLKNDNIWIGSFLKSRDYEVDKALAALVECLKWRNTFGVNDLTERLIDRTLFESGFLYFHNQDKEGNPIFNFIGRLYKKNTNQHPEVKKMFVFLLEKHARSYPGKKIFFIFDMQETGLANMDMDLIKFIINCFTNYFPNTLAAWKIVKSWLSPRAASKIKFLSKTELLEYVSEENILSSMGGSDSFEYSYPPKDSFEGFSPELGSSPKVLSPAANKVNEEPTELMEASENDQPAPTSTKKVTFEDYSRSDSTDLEPRVRKRSSSSFKSLSKEQLPIDVEAKVSTDSAVSSSTSSGLTISPSDEFVFSGTTTSGGEILQALTLTNSSATVLAFKIKTTSPESYRVRPSSGIVSPNSTVDVNVYLQPGHAASVMRDKFLVMSAAVEEGKSATDLAALWKTLPKSDIEEHRLRCRFVAVSNQQFSNADSSLGSHGNDYYTRDTETIKDLREKLCHIEKKIDSTNKKLVFIEEGLQVFIKIQLVILSAMIILLGIVLYYGTSR